MRTIPGQAFLVETPCVFYAVWSVVALDMSRMGIVAIYCVACVALSFVVAEGGISVSINSP
jgi:hypothetical protein